MFTADTITGRDARQAMRMHAGRILAARGGWETHNGGAGTPWGHLHPATGALIVPVPLGGAGRWVERWRVGVRGNADTFTTADSLSAAIGRADSLPTLPVAEPVPTHYDGHGAACWCDQPNAAR